MFKCKVCEREFSTRQSLGGHASSHKRDEDYRKKRETEKSKERREKQTSSKICKFCGKEIENGWKLGGHQTLCEMNPSRKETLLKIQKSLEGKVLTEDHRSKIGDSMKRAHEEGRAWNIGKSRWNNEPSYPEQFFMKVIENEFFDKKYSREYPIGIYSIDFAWVDKKLAIEIDGSQHQRYEEYQKRDKKKDSILIENGWKVLRISWKDLSNEPKKFIEIAKDFIGN
jgi:very-short-patch-repair endonuclease